MTGGEGRGGGRPRSALPALASLLLHGGAVLALAALHRPDPLPSAQREQGVEIVWQDSQEDSAPGQEAETTGESAAQAPAEEAPPEPEPEREAAEAAPQQQAPQASAPPPEPTTAEAPPAEPPPPPQPTSAEAPPPDEPAPAPEPTSAEASSAEPLPPQPASTEAPPPSESAPAPEPTLAEAPPDGAEPLPTPVEPPPPEPAASARAAPPPDEVQPAPPEPPASARAAPPSDEVQSAPPLPLPPPSPPRAPPPRQQAPSQAAAPRQALAGPVAPSESLLGGSRATGAVSPPALLDGARNPEPEYPLANRQRGDQGVVTVLLRVSESGEVVDVEVVSGSGHPALDDSARRAVQRWRFRPATRDGVPVAGSVRTAIHFRLR